MPAVLRLLGSSGPSRTALGDTTSWLSATYHASWPTSLVIHLELNRQHRWVRLTFCRSAVNAERTRDRTTAARSRGRQPAASRHEPTLERAAQAFSRCNGLLGSRFHTFAAHKREQSGEINRTA